MTQPHRLATGGHIDRARPIRFRFNGREYQGFEGDTLASALLANGEKLVARSFKYHRPRGIFSAGSEEPNALVQIGTGDRAEPNLKATQVELCDGLIARSVNCWPSPRFDVRALHQLAGALMPAGFYYKTFMRPHWHLFEGAIRRAAGLGIAPTEADPDRYDEMHTATDVAIVGAGPAGLAAAAAAVACGARVLLMDDQNEPGGSLLWRPPGLHDTSGWAASIVNELLGNANFQLLTRTLVAGYYDHDSLVAVQRTPATAVRQRLWRIRAQRVILATGATERPLVFPGNDRPGVMLADSVQQYLQRYAVLPGRRIVVFTNNNFAYQVAISLKEAGADVAAIIDVAPKATHAFAMHAREIGIKLLTGCVVTRTHGTRALRAVSVTSADGQLQRIECDLLCVSGGWSPNVQLHSQAGGSVRFDASRGMFVPGSAVQSNHSVGAASGTMTLSETLAEAMAAGRDAAASLGFRSVAVVTPTVEPTSFEQHVIWSIAAGRGKAFVDLASDVTQADVALAARENFVSVEHLKRYTTLGMGVDQGRTSNVNGLAIMGERTGRAPQQVGTTRFRPPFSPVTLGAVAALDVGSLYRPIKYLPAHERHVALGAVFEELAGWLRPVAYPHARESWEAAAQREARHVRTAVGLFDSSSLGKIEVIGPDAAALLDRIYIDGVSTLKVGRIRYGLMLNENGVIIDDGVVARRAPDSFIVYTTSAGADRINEWLEDWLQCEFVDLDVVVTPVTTQWANITVTGPRAREVLQQLDTDIDVSAEHFPHMSIREGHVEGIAVRVCRVSFTGELSYEINVPATRSAQLLNRLMEVGHAVDIAPFGVEALMILRTEKGYLHVGADTDGTTLPLDVRANKTRLADFIGRRSLTRSAAQQEGRLQLVGLSSAEQLPPGAQVMTGPSPCLSDGHVTSSLFSPTLSHPIALAMVRNGRRRLGEDIELYHVGRVVRANIVPPVFYDAEGARLHG